MKPMRRWRLLIAGVCVILGPVVLTAGSAQATTAGYSDPRPCSASVNGRICISQVSVNYSPSQITLSVTVGTATNPNTDPNWTNSPQTGVAWDLFVNGESSVRYEAAVADEFQANPTSPPDYKGPFAGEVSRFPLPTYTCRWDSGVVAATYDLSANTYGITFPASCIGSPASLSVQAKWIYDTTGGTGTPVTYYSPATGSCCSTIPFTQGYDLIGADGGLFSYGTSPYYGSMGGTSLSRPVAGIANDFRTGGYWEVASDGGIFAFNAPFHGSMGGTSLNAPIVGMAVDNFTGGYWMVGSDGGVFAFNAPFYGSMGRTTLSQPIVGMASLPFGNGYWLVAKDGGVFAFGSAGFYGSMGGTPLNQPILGMTNDVSTGGYWLIAADGGVFAFNAPFYGSMGGTPLNVPIVGMASTRGSGGYWFAASDGGVFSFGNAQFGGSAAGNHLGAPIVGIAGT